MPLNAGNSFFRLVPYTADRASGDWLLEVQTNTDSATALLPAFGTGPGTGQIPLVENLQMTGSGTSRGLMWTTPTSVVDQTANDGNIDRLRVRLNDTNGQLLDLRGLGVGNAQSLNETSYQFDPGLFTHNGAYTGQILTEGFAPFNRSRAFETIVVDDIAGLGGTPVGFDDVFAFRDFRQENSVRFRSGDGIVIGVAVDLSDNTFVHAEQDGRIAFTGQSREADRAFEFSTTVPYDRTLTDSWTFTAFNGSEMTTVLTPAFNAPDTLPFVRNVSLTANDLTPTISWDLPVGSTVPFDEILFGLFDDVTDDRLSIFGPLGDNLFESLAATATSFTFAPGQLEFGRQYVARVVLVDRDDTTGEIVNRSLSFLNFSAIPGSGGAPVFLPNLDENGVFNFDFDVEEAVPVVLDPFVAIGYDYEIGAGNPLFATISLPDVGDGVFDLFLYDLLGNLFDSGLDLLAGDVLDFATLGTIAGVDYSAGASRFGIRGIEAGAGLDPSDTSAFMTTVTFASSGAFTGTMTPVTVFVDDAAVSEPGSLLLMALAFLGFAAASRRGNAPPA